MELHIEGLEQNMQIVIGSSTKAPFKNLILYCKTCPESFWKLFALPSFLATDKPLKTNINKMAIKHTLELVTFVD